jgi:hypothetical protein
MGSGAALIALAIAAFLPRHTPAPAARVTPEPAAVAGG